MSKLNPYDKRFVYQTLFVRLRVSLEVKLSILQTNTFLFFKSHWVMGVRQNSFFLILTNFQYKKAFPFPS